MILYLFHLSVRGYKLHKANKCFYFKYLINKLTTIDVSTLLHGLLNGAEDIE